MKFPRLRRKAETPRPAPTWTRSSILARRNQLLEAWAAHNGVEVPPADDPKDVTP